MHLGLQAKQSHKQVFIPCGPVCQNHLQLSKKQAAANTVCGQGDAVCPHCSCFS